ncbi:MAG: DUF2914 domain-containing protein [Bacteroidetes bacterium]|nr:DUF2914 domain-containing protein [Bacteroidota bacterium]
MPDAPPPEGAPEDVPTGNTPDRHGPVDGSADDSSPPRWKRKARVAFQRSTAMRSSRAFYRKHEPRLSALFFVAGVTWDLAAYDRVDAWIVSALLFTYLLALGLLIVASALVEAGRTQRAVLLRYRNALRYGIQFCLGALLSACVIFYFQSASLTQTGGFLVLLVGLLLANEVIHRRLFNLYLLLGLYLIAAYATCILLVPVLAGSLHIWTYIVGSSLALTLVAGLIVLFWRWQVFVRWRQLVGAGLVVTLLFGLLTTAYVQNWIPPVPLAMRYGDVFHEVERRDEGFHLRYEPAPWYRFWQTSSSTVHYVPGEPVYVFAAIFAPTAMETSVAHHWQHFNTADSTWQTTDVIGYTLQGGRREGYRGYTFKRFMRPGPWRVDVRTEGGRLLGRVWFEARAVETPVAGLRERLYE